MLVYSHWAWLDCGVTLHSNRQVHLKICCLCKAKFIKNLPKADESLFVELYVITVFFSYFSYNNSVF